MKKKIKKKKKKLRSLEVEHYLCCCAESRAGKSEQSRERRSQPLCRERRCRCAERAAVQREQRPATSELEASLTEASSELDWGRGELEACRVSETVRFSSELEAWRWGLSDFSLGLGLDFHFRTKGPKRRSIITWEVKKNKNPPTGQEPVQLPVFPVFRLNRPVFTVPPVFNIFPIFCHNRTGL